MFNLVLAELKRKMQAVRLNLINTSGGQKQPSLGSFLRGAWNTMKQLKGTR